MTRDEIYLEVLKIANRLVVNRYTDLRADLHNQWVSQSEEAWRMRKMKLAYPPIPPYPNEEDVCACAVKLLSLLLNFTKKDVDDNCLSDDNEITESNVELEQEAEFSVTETQPEKQLEDQTEKPLEKPSTMFDWIKRSKK